MADTINIEPDTEGYARIARRLSEQVLEDVGSRRRQADRGLLVQIVKIAGKLRVDDPSVLARLIVALEQNESAPIMPGRAGAGVAR